MSKVSTGSQLFAGSMSKASTGSQLFAQGRFQKKIKGGSFVGVAATPLKPLPSCYRLKRRGDQL